MSSSNATKLIASVLGFIPEKGIWIKADPTNTDTVRIGGQDISGVGGWPLVKGEEMLFDINGVDKLFALAAHNGDIVHIFVR